MKKTSRTAVLGFGREGKSALAFLFKNPRYRRAEVWVLDRDKTVKRRLPGVQWQTGEGYLNDLDRFSTIIRSPGVPFNLRKIQEAIKRGTVVTSATRLFFEQVGKKPLIIGVTGTKGKGTTATLIYEILKRAGKRAVLAGNIGKPALDVLAEAKRAQFVVLELSSFQLQDLDRSAHIAVVVDVFPDHLDAHKSLKEYYDAKTAIGRFQKPTDHIFFFANNFLSAEVASRSTGVRHPVTPTSDTPEKNKEMARAVASFLGVDSAVIDKAIGGFRGLPYRLQLTRTITRLPPRHSNILQNVRILFYNDSADTNPVAAAAAVRSFKDPLVVVSGGRDAGFDYGPLATAVARSLAVRGVILIGENRTKIEKSFGEHGVRVPVTPAATLQSAVRAAWQQARKLITGGAPAVVILFAPASKSFDMFKNYADRGKQFDSIVRAFR